LCCKIPDEATPVLISVRATAPYDLFDQTFLIPAESLVYTLPSRYCQSDLLARMARGGFGQLPAGGKRVRTIADRVRQHVEYHYGTTDAKTSAFDATSEVVRPALIPIAVGRDAADVAMSTLWGLGKVREQTVEVLRISG
jgi:transglutaminase-like putative cysteine protease